ncbi:MAG: hypothetical protein H6582_04890 [Crocinitomicaceae bacterium]|nr:hypothetical protein [Crocinitomicaceae bacterium]
MQPNNFIRTNNIIFFAMMMGMIVFTIIAFVVIKDNAEFAIPGMEDPFFIIAPVVLVIGMGMGNFLFQKLITPAQEESKSLHQKTSIYFSATIIRYGLTEGPVLVAVVALLQSTNIFYLIFVGIGILYFLTLKPRPEKIAKDLNLDYDQRDEMGIK